MTSLENEDYLFLRMYSVDLRTASYSMGVLSRTEAADARECILRDIVVTYARPFSGNRGTTARSHRLLDLLPDVITEERKTLHEKLMRFRDQLFAHTDLEAYKPKPVKWERDGHVTFPMTFWGLDYVGLEAQVEELWDLIETVKATVDEEVRRLQSSL